MPSETVRPRASRVPHALCGDPGAPVGVWLGASYALGRPVPFDQPYPHICGQLVPGVMTGRDTRISFRACAACAEKTAPATADTTTGETR